ncbi:MAG: metal-dependent hydrolase [Calditrichia bacterium]
MPELTFLGHSGFLIETSKARLAIDPFLTGNPMAVLTPEQVNVDYILLTHGHTDHLGDTIAIAKRNNATVIAANELAKYCISEGVDAHAMSIGGAYQFPFGRVKFTIAHHSLSTHDGGFTEHPAGILLTVDEKTIYHAGDTGLFYDMKLIGELNSIDLAILPIGDNYTMGIDDAVIAADFLQAKSYLPMHFDTFDIIQADPNEFVEKLAAISLKGRICKIGGSFLV